MGSFMERQLISILPSVVFPCEFVGEVFCVESGSHDKSTSSMKSLTELVL